MAALVAMPLTACDEDTNPVVDVPVVGTVTGTVSAGSTGLSGVAVNLVGQVSQSATTGAGGTYTFTNVPAGSYGVSIEPSSQPDVSFSQVSRTTTITTMGETQTVDFSGSYIKTATITGIVSASGAPLAGIAVTVTGGPEAITAGYVTNGGGEYFATGLRGGTYTVSIADVAGVTFATTSAAVTVGTGETKTAHFPGEAVQMAAISGAVTVDNVGTAGIAVALSGGATTETGPGGAYAFTNLTPGSYTVTITAPADVVFEVVAKDVTVGAGETGVVNFAGVGPVEPATVSIQSITRRTVFGGPVPVDLTDVYGQIEVTLNLTRNDQELDYVDVLIGDVVVATQDFANAAAPAEMAGGEEIVQLSVPTTQVLLGANGWTPAVLNGGNEISANLYVVEGDQPIPTNKVPVVMQNEDGMLPGFAFGGDLVFTPDEPLRTAIGENDETWYAGLATFSGPQFLSYTSIVPDYVEFDIDPGCDLDGFTIVGDALTGIAVTNTFDCEEGNYWPDHTDGFDVGYPTGVGPDGTAVNYNGYFSAIGAEFYLGDGTVGPRRFVIMEPEDGQIEDSNDLWLDNVAPDVWIDYEGVVAFNDDFDQWWVKGDYDFVAEDVMSDDSGVGFVSEQAFLWVQGDPGSCAGIEVTTPAGTPLAETLVSDGDPDGYQICGYAYDALMNGAYTGASEWFGVDMVAPSARLYGIDDPGVLVPAGEFLSATPVSATFNQTVYGTVDMMGMGTYHYDTMDEMYWGLDAIDDRSGLDNLVGYPFIQTVTHDGVIPDGTTIGADGYGLILSDNWVRVDATTPFLAGIDLPGIYVYAGYAVDRAGNPSQTFTYNWLVDDDGVPETTAITPFTTSYLVGQPATFNLWGADDLEIMELGFHMTYPASGPGDVSFYYGGQAVAADRWDATFMNMLSGVQYGTSTVWGRIDYTGTDGAVPGGITYADGVDALPIDVTAELTEDAGYNPGDGSTATWTFIEYALGGWGTEADVTEAPWDNENLDVFTISDTDPGFLVEQISDSSIDEFVMDEVWLVAFGDTEPFEMVVCAVLDGANNTYSDNGTNRFYQYTFAEPAEGNPCYADDMPVGWSIRAVGVEGDALLVTDEEEIVPNPAP